MPADTFAICIKDTIPSCILCSSGTSKTIITGNLLLFLPVRYSRVSLLTDCPSPCLPIRKRLSDIAPIATRISPGIDSRSCHEPHLSSPVFCTQLLPAFPHIRGKSSGFPAAQIRIPLLKGMPHLPSCDILRVSGSILKLVRRTLDSSTSYLLHPFHTEFSYSEPHLRNIPSGTCGRISCQFSFPALCSSLPDVFSLRYSRSFEFVSEHLFFLSVLHECSQFELYSLLLLLLYALAAVDFIDSHSYLPYANFLLQ